MPGPVDCDTCACLKHRLSEVAIFLTVAEYKLTLAAISEPSDLKFAKVKDGVGKERTDFDLALDALVKHQAEHK